MCSEWRVIGHSPGWNQRQVQSRLLFADRYRSGEAAEPDVEGQERKSRTLCRQLLEVGSWMTQKMAVGAAKPTTLEGRKHQV